MGTRSWIGYISRDGKDVYFRYCAINGFPSWNGHLLKKYFNSIEKAKELIDNQPYDIKCILEDGTVEKIVPPEKISKPYHEGIDDYYKFDEKEMIAYKYLFSFGSWRVATRESDGFISIDEAIRIEQNE